MFVIDMTGDHVHDHQTGIDPVVGHLRGEGGGLDHCHRIDTG